MCGIKFFDSLMSTMTIKWYGQCIFAELTYISPLFDIETHNKFLPDILLFIGCFCVFIVVVVAAVVVRRPMCINRFAPFHKKKKFNHRNQKIQTIAHRKYGEKQQQQQQQQHNKNRKKTKRTSIVKRSFCWNLAFFFFSPVVFRVKHTTVNTIRTDCTNE